jgi:hypothetical protein
MGVLGQGDLVLQSDPEYVGYMIHVTYQPYMKMVWRKSLVLFVYLWTSKSILIMPYVDS